MITRRNFFKLAGFSTLALGAGYTTGKLTGSSKSVYYSIHGFIPEEEQVIHHIVSAFKQKIKSNSKPVVISNSKLGELVARVDLQLQKLHYENNGEIYYSLKRLNKNIDADLIIGDANNSIYSLDDLGYKLINLRNELKEKKANYIFTARYRELNFLSKIIVSNEKEVVIENERGLVDRISINKNYKNILVDGPQGKTSIEINNGIVQVQKSTCKHEICKQTAASELGNIIACAPNKVLVRVEIS